MRSVGWWRYEAIFYSFRWPVHCKFGQRANDLAAATSRSLSGIATWPRLFLQIDDEDDNIASSRSTTSITVESRQYPNGEHQRSHWQTVLPIMAARPVPDLVGGERVVVNFSRQEPLSSSSKSSSFPPPPRYSLEGNVYYNS